MKFRPFKASPEWNAAMAEYEKDPTPDPSPEREGLRECPFCGGEASLEIPSDLNTAQYDDVCVCCDECEIRGQAVLVELAENVEGRFPDEEAEAIAAWNTRASTPPGRPTREEIALALVNEYRRFMRLDAIDKLTDLPEHLYRDQLRYADVILSLLRPATSGEDIEAACMAFWNATADEFNQWANLSGEEQDGVRVGMGAAIRALGASA